MTIETFTVQLGAIRYTVDATDVDSAAWEVAAQLDADDPDTWTLTGQAGDITHWRYNEPTEENDWCDTVERLHR